MSTPSWFADATRLVNDTLGPILSIKDREHHPGRNNWGQEDPEMPADERARLAFYTASDHAQVARVLRDVSRLVDWDAVVETAEAETEDLRLAARAEYDGRMAARVDGGAA